MAADQGTTRDKNTDRSPVHLGGSSTVEANPIPVDPLAQPKGDRVGVIIFESPLGLQSEKAGSSPQPRQPPPRRQLESHAC
jgi:hypothetical protein